MDEETRAAYLARIGADRPRVADLDNLRHLHERHLRTVPFENLDIHLGNRIELTEAALVDKIVRRRRGGFCYELNGLFGALLAESGYRVELLSATAYGPLHGQPFGHLALRVTTVDGEKFLADVGFGNHARYPLRLDATGPQPDPDGVFELRPAEYGDLDVLMDGEPQYRLEIRPRELADFAGMCWYQQTSPDSHFTRNLTCSRLTDDGRVTLSGRRLIRTVAGERTERTVPEDEVLDTYLTEFAMPLDRIPTAP